MRVAISVHEERISPVFDVSTVIRIVEFDNRRIAESKQVDIGDDAAIDRAARLFDLGARILICGAISRPLEDVINARGIMTISFISGEYAEVVAAFIDGSLPAPGMLMPGCRGRRGRARRHRTGRRNEQKHNKGVK